MDDCYLTWVDQEALAKVRFHLIHPPNDLGAGSPQTPSPPPPPPPHPPPRAGWISAPPLAAGATSLLDL